jgi:amidohydrolase
MFAESAKKIVGEENVLEGTKVSMAGDDFSYFARALPATYVHIGCRNEEKGAIYPIHNPKFTVDEDCIKIAAMCYAQFAADYLNNN